MWPRKGHLRSYDVANLNIPRMRVITWSVKALLYVIRIFLTRETKWCQLEVCILFRSKVMIKFALDWHSATLWDYTLRNYRLFALSCSAPRIWNAVLTPIFRAIKDVPNNKASLKKWGNASSRSIETKKTVKAGHGDKQYVLCLDAFLFQHLHYFFYVVFGYGMRCSFAHLYPNHSVHLGVPAGVTSFGTWPRLVPRGKYATNYGGGVANKKHSRKWCDPICSSYHKHLWTEAFNVKGSHGKGMGHSCLPFTWVGELKNLGSSQK